MKQPAPTNINRREDRQADLKRAITELLKLNDQDYADLQYSMGILYLKTYLEDDEHYADLLSRSKIFWNWWKNHWAIRDATFLNLHEKVYISNNEIRRQLYNEYHNGSQLADCIHPNSVLLNETYADMMSDLVKGEVHAV